MKMQLFKISSLGFSLLKSLQWKRLHFQKQVIGDTQYRAFYMGLSKQSVNLHQLTITQLYSNA